MYVLDERRVRMTREKVRMTRREMTRETRVERRKGERRI